MAIFIGNGVAYEESTTGSGTGNYDSFLRLQSNDEDEEGFNTDVNGLANNKNGIWTHSIRVGDLATVIIDGVAYFELRLDLNEDNTAAGQPIRLEDLRIFYSENAAIRADYLNNFASLTKVFDLDLGLNLTDINSGSGTDDYKFLVRADLFPDPTDYFTLYSQFSGADGGFEEWRVKSLTSTNEPAPIITLIKTAAPVQINEGASSNILYTYTLTSQSAVTDPLQITSFVDNKGTPGTAADDVNLLFGVSLAKPLGIYYISGDLDDDKLLDSTETWLFNYTHTGVVLNAGQTLTNIAVVSARDNEGIIVGDDDDAVVTGLNVNPAITLVKTASTNSIAEGSSSNILYSYTLTSQSASTDPLTITSLVDDKGTPGIPGDDVNLLDGIDLAQPLGIYYISGDIDGDKKLDSTESWLFNYTHNGVVLNAGATLTNIAAIVAQDDEGNSVGDTDDEVVTGLNVNPAITLVKTASVSGIQAGQATPVIFTYKLTNSSSTTLDPLSLTSLIDDNGTLDAADDINLLFGIDDLHPLGVYYVGGDDGDKLLELGEEWSFSNTMLLTLDPGETHTNVVTVNATDDEGTPVSANDDAAVAAYNLGRTPGFWSNNGSLLWDGSSSTFPKAGTLGMTAAGTDLAYLIKDTNGDGALTAADSASRQYLMIGDWNGDGIANADENVLVIGRTFALSLLNSSEKQQQDGRYVLARDMVAAWLNHLAGSFVGDSDDTGSVMHYIDEATAWLIQTTVDQNHILSSSDFTTASKVAQSSWQWQAGFDFDGDLVAGENMAPPTGHDLGAGTLYDIMSGSAIHTGLDHYNNFGFI